jgi:antitoxin ParD1/3/4
MTSMNFTLPESLRDFVEDQVKTNGYGSVSEYLRELIRDAQKRKAEEKLEMLLLEGLQSGESTPMTAEDWADLRREVRERAAARAGGNLRE